MTPPTDDLHFGSFLELPGERGAPERDLERRGAHLPSRALRDASGPLNATELGEIPMWSCYCSRRIPRIGYSMVGLKCFKYLTLYHFHWLVVWNIFYFPIYWVSNHPNWRTHIFQRGGPTTNQTFMSFVSCRVFAVSFHPWDDDPPEGFF